MENEKRVDSDTWWRGQCLRWFHRGSWSRQQPSAGLRPFINATGTARIRLGRVMRKKVMVGVGMGVQYRTLISVYAPPFCPTRIKQKLCESLTWRQGKYCGP